MTESNVLCSHLHHLTSVCWNSFHSSEILTQIKELPEGQIGNINTNKVTKYRNLERDRRGSARQYS